MSITEKYNQKGILHCVHAGSRTFGSTSHLKNFVKYLYGAASGRHIINSHTKNNVCTEKIYETGSYIFTVDPINQYDNFIKKHNVAFRNFDNFENDVFYIPFLLRVKGKLVSNFITQEDDEITVNLGDNLLERLVDYYGSEEAFLARIEKVFESHKGDFIPYVECKGEGRMILEQFLHRVGNKTVKKDTLLSISHDDQFEDHPSYHLHRLYKVGV